MPVLSSTCVNIKLLPAEDGDCILLQFNNDSCILIDFGRCNTYNEHLKNELLRLKEDGKVLNLVVVTHVDADHIEGALPFIIENGAEGSIIPVNEVWHNTFRHLQFNTAKVSVLPEDERKELKQLIMLNPPVLNSDPLSDISVRQGVSFGSNIIKFNYSWNTSFDHKAVCKDVNKFIEISGVKFIILSPGKKELEQLGDLWLKKLNSIIPGFKITDDAIFDDAFEFYMQHYQEDEPSLEPISNRHKYFDIEKFATIEEVDKSKTNRSSIAFIMEYEERKMLFLGDAHEEVIYDSLLELRNNSYELKFDLVKISHHGSNRNISTRLVDMIESKRYLFSTNGEKHNHPDLECIAKIIKKRTAQKKELIFNYHLDKIVDLEQFQDKYNYLVKYLNEFDL